MNLPAISPEDFEKFMKSVSQAQPAKTEANEVPFPLLSLPQKMLEMVLERLPAKEIPFFMFSCKTLFKFGVKKRWFQKFLAWRYAAAGFLNVPTRSSLFLIHDINYFENQFDVAKDNPAYHGGLDNFIYQYYYDLEPIVCEMVLLATFDAVNADPFKCELDDFACPAGTLSAIGHLRDFQAWLKARQDFSILNAVQVSELRDPQALFSKWFKADRQAFNAVFFQSFSLGRGSFEWSDGEIFAFLSAEGTELDLGIDPYIIYQFFFTFRRYLTKEPPKMAAQLNAANASAKLAPYLRAHYADRSCSLFSMVKARFLPEFSIGLNDPLVSSTEEVKKYARILYNSGKMDNFNLFYNHLKAQGIELTLPASDATFKFKVSDPYHFGNLTLGKKDGRKRVPKTVKKTGSSLVAKLSTQPGLLVPLKYDNLNELADFIIPQEIPSFLFSCKQAFKIGIKGRFFQRYLAWKYQVPGLVNVPGHYHMFLIDGMEHFKNQLVSHKTYDYCVFEEKLAALSGRLDRIFLELILLASHEAPGRNKKKREFYHQPRLTMSVIGHFRGFEGWRKARKSVSSFRSQCISHARDPISIFSKWFNQDPVIFNATFFPTAGMGQIPYVWSDEDAVTFLLAEGTYLDSSLEPSRMKMFFEALFHALGHETERKAIILNAAEGEAKVMTYVNAHLEAFDLTILKYLRARFDPDYLVSLNDPSIVEALEVRDLAVVLRNAGKHQQAAPFLALLADKELLLSQYQVPVSSFNFRSVYPTPPVPNNAPIYAKRSVMPFLDPMELLKTPEELDLRFNALAPIMFGNPGFPFK